MIYFSFAPYSQVLDHLSLIPDPKSSQVTQYLRKTVAKKRISLEKPSSPSATNGAPSSSFIGAAKHVSDGSPSDREVSAFESMPLSTDNVIELTDILSKLKDPASSQQVTYTHTSAHTLTHTHSLTHTSTHTLTHTHSLIHTSAPGFC